MKYLCLLALTIFGIQCSSKKSVTEMSEEELKSYAHELAQRFIIADGHVDLPYMLVEKNVVVSPATKDTLVSTTMGDFDFERSRKGGLDAPFMSIYIPVKFQQAPGYGISLADSLMDQVDNIIRLLPEKFAAAKTPEDIDQNARQGKVSLPMGMENGSPVGTDLNRLQYLFDRGIRYITLTHNRDNQICDASNDTTHTWNGLSPFGRDVVAEMNRLGMMVDISHVDDSTFYQVMKLSKAPAIASHSSCRHFAPKAKRDLSDDMIKTIGEQGGVIMINYYPNFLDSTASVLSAELDRRLKEKGLEENTPEGDAFIKKFRQENPGSVTVETVANHIDHIRKIAGINHIGIGSDYDGVGGNLPRGLEDVTTYPTLIASLLKRGYSEEDIEKICSGNLFRVWNKVISVSDSLRKESVTKL